MRRKSIGALRERVTFEEAIQVPDGAGGYSSTWVPAIAAVPAEFKYLRGGETVTAARLEARQPLIVRVMATDQTGDIKTNWRIVDLTDGAVMNIRSKERTKDRRYFEFLAEAGVPV